MSRVVLSLTELEADALFSAAYAPGSGDEEDLKAVFPEGRERAAYWRAIEKLQWARRDLDG